jgi:hypothetical protein
MAMMDFAMSARITGPWTKEENHQLYDLIHQFENCWKWIAQYIPSQNYTEIRNQWEWPRRMRISIFDNIGLFLSIRKQPREWKSIPEFCTSDAEEVGQLRQ